jgi:hypothetical protein
MALEDREMQFLQTFVIATKRERYAGFLRSPERRSKSEGTNVCCVPGRLAFYEGEAPKNRFILRRGR